ncbi:hypothetical protein BDV37DRAFT_266382 [Aspergillus pseudonomiae]|uniref:Uncharacterized protein n=1 Tax=Aspergillus pseudonomiae TaxID=1506151 RepID=A0A5N7CU75_9EURO|nr:uncharacterized protein BDV37DRAFT_266382 [Aspergillus pseudonomiae]KAE8397163.1 hypothetical protein BDV37DRAFT_266382 [Aspergillus pseudonomiae]
MVKRRLFGAVKWLSGGVQGGVYAAASALDWVVVVCYVDDVMWSTQYFLWIFGRVFPSISLMPRR